MTSTALQLGEPAPATANALRKIRRSWIKARGGVKKAAFMPRENGNDRDGLSVSIETQELIGLHRTLFESESFCACSISASSIRGLRLDLVYAPKEDDPAHALITGIPDRTRGQEELEQAERFAEKLAERAAEYRFPPGGVTTGPESG